jgi:putative glycosyltransferase (TIGR04372 family)
MNDHNRRLSLAHHANYLYLRSLILHEISQLVDEDLQVLPARAGIHFSNKHLCSRRFQKVVEFVNQALISFAINYGITYSALFKDDIIKDLPNLAILLICFSTLNLSDRYHAIKNIVKDKLSHLSPNARFLTYNTFCSYLWHYFDSDIMGYLVSGESVNPANDVISLTQHLQISSGHILYLSDILNYKSFDDSNKLEIFCDSRLEFQKGNTILSIVLSSLISSNTENCKVYDSSTQLHLSNYSKLRYPDKLSRSIVLTKNRSKYYDSDQSSIDRPPRILINLAQDIARHDSRRFFVNFKERNVCAIHIRDSAYSGPGQSSRDVSLDNYNLAIHWLAANGYSVIILNNVLRSQYRVASDNVIYLADVLHSQADTFDIVQNATLFIGINSGVTHWRDFLMKPSLILNSTALPAGVNPNHLYSTKTLTPISNINGLPDAFKLHLIDRLLCSTWDPFIQNYFMLSELSSDEILLDIKYYVEMMSLGDPSRIGVPVYDILDHLITLRIRNNGFYNYKLTPRCFGVLKNIVSMLSTSI